MSDEDLAEHLDGVSRRKARGSYRWLSSQARGARLRADLAIELVPEALSESASSPAGPFHTGTIESGPVWAISAAVGLELDTL